MERSQPAIVVAIECVAGEWSGNGDILRTGDVVEEIKIGTSPAIRSPFKGGRSGVRKILHAAFKRGDTSIRVRVRRGREEIKAVITATEVLVPNSKDPMAGSFVQDLIARVFIPYAVHHQEQEF